MTTGASQLQGRQAQRDRRRHQPRGHRRLCRNVQTGIRGRGYAHAPGRRAQFFEYHLYEVQRPVVKDQQTKQIEFVTGSGITATKFFVYDGRRWATGPTMNRYRISGYGTTSNEDVQVMLEFTNSVTDGLGVPLPGTIRVFKKDVDGSPF